MNEIELYSKATSKLTELQKEVIRKLTKHCKNTTKDICSECANAEDVFKEYLAESKKEIDLSDVHFNKLTPDQSDVHMQLTKLQAEQKDGNICAALSVARRAYLEYFGDILP